MSRCLPPAFLVVFAGVPAWGQTKVPNWMPCEDPIVKSMPFCDHTRPTAERVQNIISMMTQAEMCQQTYDKMGTIAKIPSWEGYNWNTECLHGLGGICLKVDGVTRCPSVFPAPPAMGASFNLTVGKQLGEVISDEIRAYSNSNGHRSYQNRPIGVSAWGPNLNMYRDPRWGRNVEVPSEDPFHSGAYGVAYTKGLQWGDDSRYTKAIGALKHYTIYSVESTRGRSYFEISMRDIEETYLPQFKAPVVEAKSLGYMCSYAAFTNPALQSDSASHPHSQPLCASKFFATTKMVEEYGFEGYVQSDCGAVGNMVGGKGQREHFAANRSDAAAKAIADGLMNSMCDSFMPDVCNAIQEGLLPQSELVARVTRSFTLLMNAGLFDPVEIQNYTKIPFEVINQESAQAANLEAARQSLVLMKNGAPGKTALLPLKKGLKLALIGPHTQTQKDLAGNYFEDIGLGTCAGPTCVPTLKTAFDRVNGGNATVAAGCDMKCASAYGFAAAVAAAKASDTVILALGIDGDICGEGRDRMDIRLPGLQYDLAKAVIAVGKPTVLLLFSGGLIDIADLKLDDIAIIQAWFPGATGGTAVAETVFGEQNRFGKLPFTWYASNFTAQSDFMNMNMTDGPGRSYKYLKDPSLALWPFGYGLSYTTFEISQAGTAGTLSSATLEDPLVAAVRVTNTGHVTGDEVVFLFKNSTSAVMSWAANNGQPVPPLPHRELIGFERVTLAPGESKVITFNSAVTKLSTVDDSGTRHVLAGQHELIFSRGRGKELHQRLLLSIEDQDRLIVSTVNGLPKKEDIDLIV